MGLRSLLIPMALFGSLFLLVGCSEPREAPPTQQNSGQEPPAYADKADSTPLEKAVASHAAFLQALFQIGGGRDMEFFRRRADLAQTTLDEARMLLNESQDPQAREFLTKYTDLLQEYAEAGRFILSADEEIQENDKAIEAANANQGQLDSSTQYMALDMLKQARSDIQSRQANYVSAFNRAERELKELK